MLKAFVLMMATLFAVFSLPVVADSTEGFAPVADHSVPVGYVGQQTVAIAECDRCMYAGLGDKQPLIAMNDTVESEVVGLNHINAWIRPYEVGWRS